MNGVISMLGIKIDAMKNGTSNVNENQVANPNSLKNLM
jgi:hypothetical protein